MYTKPSAMVVFNIVRPVAVTAFKGFASGLLANLKVTGTSKFEVRTLQKLWSN